jgi:hypothetical protein
MKKALIFVVFLVAALAAVVRVELVAQEASKRADESGSTSAGDSTETAKEKTQENAEPNTPLEVEDVIRRAVAATKAAEQSIPRAKGQGRCTYILWRTTNGRLNPKPAQNQTSTFSFAFSGENNWVKFVPGPRGEDDATIYATSYICDGDSVMIGEFLKGKRGLGAEGRIERSLDLYALPEEFGTPPERFPVMGASPLYPELGRFDKYDGPTLKKSEGRYVVQFTKPGNHAFRFHVDPSKGFHVVRFELLEPDGYVTMVYRKEWATTADGLWYVRKFCQEHFPIRMVYYYESWTYTVDSFQPNVHIPDDVFTIDALGLPVGALMWDNRVHPAKRLTIDAPKTDMAALEEFLGELPKAGN